MIALWILLAILAILLFFLFMPVHIVFQYRDKATVILKVLFLRFDGMELFRKLIAKDEEGLDVPKRKSDVKASKSKGKKKADPLGFVEFLIHIGKVISLALKEHFRRARVDLKELYVSIGTDDAAKTALIYGGSIQAANALCVLLQRFTKFRCNNKNLVIAPDFTSEKSRFSIHLDMTVRLFFVLGVLFRAYFRFFERKEMNNERNSVKTSH